MKEKIYRRQFFLGDMYLHPFDNWQYLKINDFLLLSAHPDLEINHLKSKESQTSITLIGYIIDPYGPKKSNLVILQELLDKSLSFSDILKNTYHLSGRWVIIYENKDMVRIFHDPCGFRQVFYTKIKDNIFCASQPNLLAEMLNIKEDKRSILQGFIKSEKYEESERSWIGDETVFSSVKHLLPNHYLDFKNSESERFWLDEEYSEKNSLENSINEVSSLLEGSIIGLSNRKDCMLAVTAGWDSRVLLAASKKIKNKLKYFVSTNGVLSYDHMDIRIPKNLSEKLNLNLEVIDSLPALSDDFIETLKINVSQARTIPKTRKIQYFINSNKININGNGSEIIRSRLGNKHPNTITIKYLKDIFSLNAYDGFNASKYDEYVEIQIKKWLKKSTSFSESKNFSLVNLFYWEQRMGNWGAMYQAEQDIAIEEFSPFNNRKVLMILNSVENKYMSGPKYIFFLKIAENLWNETLSEPVNPLSFKEKLLSEIAGVFPLSFKRKIQYLLKRILTRFK